MTDREPKTGLLQPQQPSRRAPENLALTSGSQLASCFEDAQPARLSSSVPACSNSQLAAVAGVGTQLPDLQTLAYRNSRIHDPKPRESAAPSAFVSRERGIREARTASTWLPLDLNSQRTELGTQRLGATQARPSGAPPFSTAGNTGHFLFGVRLPESRAPVPSANSAPPIQHGIARQGREAAPSQREESCRAAAAQPASPAVSRAAAVPVGMTILGHRAVPGELVPPDASTQTEARELSWGSCKRRERTAQYGPITNKRQIPESRRRAGPRTSSEAGLQTARAARTEADRAAGPTAIEGAGAGTCRRDDLSIRAGAEAGFRISADRQTRSAPAARPSEGAGSAASGGAHTLDETHPYQKAIRHEIALFEKSIMKLKMGESSCCLDQGRLQTLRKKIQKEQETLCILRQRQKNLSRDIKQIEESQKEQPDYCDYIKQVLRENDDPKSRRHLFEQELGKLVRKESTDGEQALIGQCVRVLKKENAEGEGSPSHATVRSLQILPGGSVFGGTTRQTPVRSSAFKAAVAWNLAEDSDVEADASRPCVHRGPADRGSADRTPAATAAVLPPTASPFLAITSTAPSAAARASPERAAAITSTERAAVIILEIAASLANAAPASAAEPAAAAAAAAAGPSGGSEASGSSDLDISATEPEVSDAEVSNYNILSP